jgi:hypothetical protein
MHPCNLRNWTPEIHSAILRSRKRRRRQRDHRGPRIVSARRGRRDRTAAPHRLLIPEKARWILLRRQLFLLGGLGVPAIRKTTFNINCSARDYFLRFRRLEK